MNTLKTNIRSRLKYLKMTQSQLADKAGLSQAMINKLVTGKVASTTKILELSSALQCQPDWLLYGKGEVSEESNISYAPPVKRMIPVISWVQAGEFCEGNVLALHEVDEWLPCPTSASDKAFGLRVKGDSMTSPHSGDRSYPEGIIIYVDPEAEVTSGRRVIAKSNTSDEATFKTYVEDDGLRFLKPINPQFPMKEMTADVHICGVVIGSYWPE